MRFAAQRLPAGSLSASVFRLLRLRSMILVNEFRRARRRQKLVTLSVTVLILVFFVGALWLSFRLLDALRSPLLAEYANNPSLFLEDIAGMVLSGAFLGILLTSFGVLLQALYLSKDMNFLLSAPLPMRAVFIAKLTQAILPNLGFICLFSLPVLFGLGLSLGYTWIYYPLTLLVMFGLALTASGIGSVSVMLVARLFSPRRTAELLGFIGAILSILCSQAGQLAGLGGLGREDARAALQFATRFNVSWSPLAWAGRGLVGLGEGDWLVGASYLLLSLGVAALVFGVSLVGAERLYYSGWASMQVVEQRRKSRKSRSAGLGRMKTALLRFHGLPSQLRAIIWKDYFVLWRDPHNISQLVTPLILGIIYAGMLLSFNRSRPSFSSAPGWAAGLLDSLPLYSSVGLSLFVAWMFVSRLAGMGFAQEGRSYWILKSAPVSENRLIQAKFLVAYLPSLLMGWVFLLANSILAGTGAAFFWFGLPAVAFVIAGSTGINMAIGITGTNLRWEDPRQMQRFSSTCLGSLVTFAYLPAALGLLLLPVLALLLLGLSETAGQLVGLAICGGFCLFCAVVPLRLVRGRVRLLAE